MDGEQTAALVGLKAELLRKQAEVDKAKAKLKNVETIPKSKLIKSKIYNEKKDKKSDLSKKQDNVEDIESVKTLKKSKLMLQAKSRLYEELSRKHLNMNPNFLVDFEHKSDDLNQFEEEKSNYNSDEYDSDDGWVEYTDCFGRTRKCLREDLKKMQEEDEELREKIVKKTDVKNSDKLLYVEYRTPAKEPEIEIMRRKWEEQTEKLSNKTDIHYQDILFDEARTHGVGYFAFSQDEDERAKQQESLFKLRKETEQKQKENEQIQEMKNKMNQNRLRVALIRKKVRAGLPVEEIEEISFRDKIEQRKLKEDECNDLAVAAALFCWSITSAAIVLEEMDDTNVFNKSYNYESFEPLQITSKCAQHMQRNNRKIDD